MQFPVPQFTEVEDRIIGPLTLKQFGIIFGVGMIIFLVFTSSKNIPLTVLFGVVLGLPAIGIAFAKFNGRPVYNVLMQTARFVASEKALYFHKESAHLGESAKLKNEELNQGNAENAVQPGQTQDRLAAVQKILEQQAAEEKELVGRIK